MVIVITGPIASGKSAVARELARELDRVDVRAAVIDLDLVHDMLPPNRAQGDPTRGVSRDPAVLGPYFATIGPVLAAVPATDIVIDTERHTAHSAARAISNLMLSTSS